MQYSILGSSGLNVSRVCLGSMTWGRQNNQQEANEQIDYALSRGVNFIDTAEMYAVPPTPGTYGTTETIIGHWLAANANKRADIILATKIAGNGLSWIRGGADITGQAITASVEASLARLQTDYIDVYQLHWPNRTSPHFGKHWPGRIQFSDVDTEAHIDQMLEILEALSQCMDAGKIRHFGLSDDTPWGIHQYCRLAEMHNLPKPVSIQNEFNLLHFKDWPYLIEHCVHSEVAYLPWSPLAGGALSGKYLNGAMPEGSRWTLSQRNGLFRQNAKTDAAIARFVEIAHEHNITPSQLALAWCNQVDGVTSTIIGATSLAQLTEDIDAFEIGLSEAAVVAITETLKEYPSPF
ncbi:aldo/keto reductase [Marinibactrum halimedae]|uniref:Aldo/keto reductase n=1 Tax=Marinibactrum halimedae TaxID=1444977 RepID=A0AA37T5D6_9GAMM|nr:aldo/keto reductase [Marinibactrum halimedae]MCD9461147.1 aldo/keto reductase [Marinibactrum halimedae]GLS26034.1 aldo/keto reductase [Marinibactrum halimedae]